MTASGAASNGLSENTRQAVSTLVAREGSDADAIAIGPAGERRVRFAAMAHYWKNREGVSGRGGIGAVLGSKHIKAVVVRGARKTSIADAPALKALLEATREPLKTGTKALSTFGTPFLVGPINALGALGSYNLKTEVVVFTGNVEIRQQRGTLSGQRVVYNMKTNQVESGGAGNGRVKMRILPKSAQTPAAKN